MNISNTSCYNNLTFWDGLWQQACDYYNGTDRSVPEVKDERCVETWTSSYEDYLERDIQLLAELTDSRENCTRYRDRHATQEQICRNISTQLQEKIYLCLLCDRDDSGSTTTGTPTTPCPGQDACNDYDQCYSGENATFVGRCSTQQQLSVARKAEYRALMRINCLLDVLVVDLSQQYDTLIGCIETTYSDEALTIICGTPPNPTPCTLCP